MTVEDARELYEAIGEDESLRSNFEGLETQDEVLDTMLKVGETCGIDVSRSDVETLLEKLAEEAETMDDEELENVAGGSAPDRPGVCMHVSYNLFG